MCPISGIVQFLIVVVTVLLLCHAVVVKSLKVTFNPKNATIHMHENLPVKYSVYSPSNGLDTGEYLIYCENPHIAYINDKVILNSDSTNGTFNITGNFLGQTTVKVKNKETNEPLEDKIDIVVIREQRIIDKIFTGTTATLVAIIYINFGCVVNWGELKNILKKPIGPAIGFVGQFIIMPVLSYVIGLLLFPDNPEMRLGMFFTGVSPAGGASNIWTAILDGNIDLSIIMTTISTFAAFAMMPLWIFTLGKLIFDKGNLAVPYREISTYVIALVIPLAIGYLIKRYMKKTGLFLARILKGFSSLLILFIVIFAIITNLYLFELFSWRIVVAGMGLPYAGYLLGYLMAKIFRQSPPDSLAISIETGIQNTGIAIFLLRFALPQPQADLTTVAPVSVAIMTPLALVLIYVYKKISARWSSHKKLTVDRSILNLPHAGMHSGVDKISMVS